MIAWTRRNHAPVISSVEAHRAVEVAENGHAVFCVDGTLGQRKLDFTLLPRWTYMEFDNTFACPCDLFEKYQQVIFPKRTADLLDNPKAERFVSVVSTAEFIIYGVALESSVKALALGLLAREKRVTVVPEACGYWSRGTADLAIRQMVAKGARTTTLDELRLRKLARKHRYSTPTRGHVPGSANGNGRIRGNGRHPGDVGNHGGNGKAPPQPG
jgi:nicotinamidase-related amidase